MSYNNLIEHIFGEKRECISERDFLQKLPKLLETPNRHGNNRWNGENLALIVIKRDGVGENERTFKDIAEHFGVSKSAVKVQYNYALSLLSRPMLAKEYVTELSEYKISYIQEYYRDSWKKSLTWMARSILMKMDIEEEMIKMGLDEEKDCVKILFGRPPRMDNRMAIYPTVPDSHAMEIRYKACRMPLNVFNEIRDALGIDPFEPLKRKPTASEISRAVKLLESEGYTVKKSNHQSFPPITR